MNNNQLSKQIENKRAELIDIVTKEGLNSPIAIQYSQELDELINHYNRLLTKKNTSKYTNEIVPTT